MAENTEEKRYLDVIGTDGNTVQCEILFFFEDAETGNEYIAYADKYPNKDQEKRIYASEMRKEGEKILLNNTFSDRGEIIIAAVLEAAKKIGEESNETGGAE